MKRLAALILLFALLLSLSACRGEDRVLSVGILSDRLPLAAEGRNGYEGFEIEFCRKIAEEMGRRVEFRAVTAESGLAEVASGGLDLVMGLGEDMTGSESVIRIGPYMLDRLVMVLPTDSAVTKAADLAGCRVVLRRGEGAESFLAANPALKNSFSSVVYTKDLYSAMLDIMVSDFDAALMSESEARWRITSGKMKLSIAAESLNGAGYPLYFAAAADNTLSGHVGNAIYALSTAGELTALSEKWFGADIFPSSEELRKSFGIILQEDAPQAGEDAESFPGYGSL